jgi:cytochrome c-type biogenesis protein CcmH
VTSAGAAAPGITVRGEVALDAALRGKVPAGLTLFILAKSVSSPGPPVAILRTTTGTWPLKFQLDDSQSMLPDRKLSTAGMVTIEARTSKTGQAMPAPGDFQGVTAQLDPRAGKPVRVVIQRVIG